jgi:hypothetical protein
MERLLSAEAVVTGMQCCQNLQKELDVWISLRTALKCIKGIVSKNCAIYAIFHRPPLKNFAILSYIAVDDVYPSYSWRNNKCM